MPNTLALYTQITRGKTGDEKPETQVKEPDAGRSQLLHSWKSSTITRELVIKQQEEIDKLIEESVALSISYPQHKNPEKVIQNLIRVDTIRKMTQDYV